MIATQNIALTMLISQFGASHNKVVINVEKDGLVEYIP